MLYSRVKLVPGGRDILYHLHYISRLVLCIFGCCPGVNLTNHWASIQYVIFSSYRMKISIRFQTVKRCDKMIAAKCYACYFICMQQSDARNSIIYGHWGNHRILKLPCRILVKPGQNHNKAQESRNNVWNSWELWFLYPIYPEQNAAILLMTFSNAFSWMNCVLTKISLNFIPGDPVENISSLEQVMT